MPAYRAAVSGMRPQSRLSHERMRHPSDTCSVQLRGAADGGTEVCLLGELQRKQQPVKMLTTPLPLPLQGRPH